MMPCAGVPGSTVSPAIRRDLPGCAGCGQAGINVTVDRVEMEPIDQLHVENWLLVPERARILSHPSPLNLI